MKAKGFAISRPLRNTLYASIAILFLSGLVWIYAHFYLSQRTDYGNIPSPYEAWSMQIHGAAVPIFLILFGWLFPAHISRAYRAGKNLISGIALLSVVLSLVITGYLLYYCGNESIRSFSSVAHSIGGAFVVLILALHILLGRKIYRVGRR